VCPLAKVVDRFVSTTFSTRASISGLPSRSTRRNRIPELGEAGRKVIVTRLPLCKPVPEKLAGPLMVCCCSTSALNRPLLALASHQSRSYKDKFGGGVYGELAGLDGLRRILGPEVSARQAVGTQRSLAPERRDCKAKNVNCKFSICSWQFAIPSS